MRLPSGQKQEVRVQPIHLMSAHIDTIMGQDKVGGERLWWRLDDTAYQA